MKPRYRWLAARPHHECGTRECKLIRWQQERTANILITGSHCGLRETYDSQDSR